MVASEKIERILKASEMVCPSIIIGFYYDKGYCTHYLVIDYVLEDFKCKTDVIKKYLECGNSSDSIRGYTSENILVKFDDPSFEIKYFFDISTHLIDPEKDTAVLTVPSSYKITDPDEIPNLRFVLEEFCLFLDAKEKFEDYRPLFKYIEGEFTSKEEINRSLEKNQHITNFSELTIDSDYFDMKLF